MRPAWLIGGTLVIWMAMAAPAQAYSVLAHEAAIDVAWDNTLRPLLVRRFPRSTNDELQMARSYAYGGSVIQDLGYYPFGNKFFSNLLHYTRSGDFVESLLREARNLDEFAFALGALAHYANDNTGHPEAVNRAVPMIYPKLRAKYGDSVTYVQAPKQHVIVEFSFDVVQMAGGAYLPDSYQRFIGFRVASDLLDRAFVQTYGLRLDDLFADKERAISTYRYAVSQIVPALTKAAWRDKREEIQKLLPGVDQRGFVLSYSRAAFERDYGSDYDKPKWFARFLGVLYRLVPKIGPLKPLSFKAPTPEAEAMFTESFRDASRRFRAALTDVADRRFDLRNTNFDTGQRLRRGAYPLADETYAELLELWHDRDFEGLPPGLRADLLAFYRSAPDVNTAAPDEKLSAAVVALANHQD